MKLVVVAVGRVRDAHYRALCEDYARRIARFGSFEVIEVKDARGREPERARKEEGERLRAKLPQGCLAVALDERGIRRSSTDLAAWMEDKARFGPKELRLVLGGPYGLDEATKDACKESLRLSELTLPHELARLLLLEQLYRAWTLRTGRPYHHA